MANLSRILNLYFHLLVLIENRSSCYFNRFWLWFGFSFLCWFFIFSNFLDLNGLWLFKNRFLYLNIFNLMQELIWLMLILLFIDIDISCLLFIGFNFLFLICFIDFVLPNILLTLFYFLLFNLPKIISLSLYLFLIIYHHSFCTIIRLRHLLHILLLLSDLCLNFNNRSNSLHSNFSIIMDKQICIGS